MSLKKKVIRRIGGYDLSNPTLKKFFYQKLYYLKPILHVYNVSTKQKKKQKKKQKINKKVPTKKGTHITSSLIYNPVRLVLIDKKAIFFVQKKNRSVPRPFPGYT